MIRSEILELPAYFDRYINMTDDVDLITALEISLQELQNPPLAEWTKLGDQVYAPGKWTIKDIIQHTMDTERVFTYRALAFSRGQQDVMGYDEDAYANNADTSRRTLEGILEEAVALRKSTILLFKSFSEEQLNRQGNGFKGKYSVRDAGYIIAGHQRWHNSVIEERYLPLLQ